MAFRPSSRGARPISGLLRQSLRRAGIEAQVDGALAMEMFSRAIREALGVDAAKEVRPRFVRHGTLTVDVVSAVAATEVRLREEAITTRINTLLGSPAIAHIRCAVRADAF